MKDDGATETRQLRQGHRGGSGRRVGVAISSGAGAALFIGVTFGAYVIPPVVQLPFDLDRELPASIATGFYAPEQAPDGMTFAWTATTATIRLEKIDRHVPWVVRIRFGRGGRPSNAPQATAVFSIDGVERARAVAPPRLSGLELEAPAAQGRGLTLSIGTDRTFVPGPHDTRALGVVIDEIDIEARGAPYPPSGVTLATAIAGGALGLCLGGIGLPALATSLMLTAGAVLNGWLMRMGSAVYQPPSEAAARTAVGFALVMVVVWAIASRVRRRQPSLSARLAVAATMLFGCAKILLILHPDMPVGDTIFHVNRLKRVLQASYYFTSAAPGGEFPYPIALYVLASWVRWSTDDWGTLLRTMAALGDACAGFALWAGVTAAWRAPGLAFVALVLYHLTPAGFQVLGTAYLTNAFGQSMAVCALAALVALPNRPSPGLLIAALIATLVAFLSHFSTFLILAGILAFTAGLYAVAGDAAAKRSVRLVSIVAGCALVGSIALFYGHFGESYREMAARLGGQSASVTSTAAVVAEVPEQKREAHQTTWAPGWIPLHNRIAAVPGYIGKYLGWGLVVLAVIGGWRQARRGARDPLSLMLWAWTGTCAVFFVLGVLTPIDLRYYLALFPALTVLAARAVTDGWQAGPSARLWIGLVFAWVVWTGASYWLAWFSPMPPR